MLRYASKGTVLHRTINQETTAMMKAEDIMTKDVVTIRGSATVAEAVGVMKEKKFAGAGCGSSP